MPLQDIPLRIPDTWSPTWFRTFVTEVLGPADVRNAVGVGATITSTQNSVATISTTADYTAALAVHNHDPFSHAEVINAHTAESNPHPRYGQLEDMAFFLGE